MGRLSVLDVCHLSLSNGIRTKKLFEWTGPWHFQKSAVPSSVFSRDPIRLFLSDAPCSWSHAINCGHADNACNSVFRKHVRPKLWRPAICPRRCLNRELPAIRWIIRFDQIKKRNSRRGENFTWWSPKNECTNNNCSCDTSCHEHFLAFHSALLLSFFYFLSLVRNFDFPFLCVQLTFSLRIDCVFTKSNRSEIVHFVSLTSSLNRWKISSKWKKISVLLICVLFFTLLAVAAASAAKSIYFHLISLPVNEFNCVGKKIWRFWRARAQPQCILSLRMKEKSQNKTIETKCGFNAVESFVFFQLDFRRSYFLYTQNKYGSINVLLEGSSNSIWNLRLSLSPAILLRVLPLQLHFLIATNTYTYEYLNCILVFYLFEA